MSNFVQIELLLHNLLVSSACELSNTECAEVQAFIDVGEYGLALETTVDIYAEKKKIPSTEILLLIKKLSTAMSMTPESVFKRLQK